MSQGSRKQSRLNRQRRDSRKRYARRPGFDELEQRCLLAANDFSVVPFWDGETSGPPDALMNRFGGNPVAGLSATISFETSTVHSGVGAFRIDTNGAILPNGFDFIGTAFTGFGPSAAYVDTRDITNFDGFSVWLKNETSAAFRLVFELKDFRDSNDHRARFPVNVSAANGWTRIDVPLDLNAPGWTVIGTPDLSRAKLMAFVIEGTTATVNGQIYLDDMTLTEKGGTLDPQAAAFGDILNRIGERQFRGLWGSRDRDTGLVPTNSSFADVMALNSTAGLLQVLPAAVGMNWVSQADADAYVAQVVTTLHVVMNNVQAAGNGGFIPPRYIDRVQLTPNFVREESPVDAAFVFLAMYQYRSLPTTSPALTTSIDGLLDRFDFASFSSPTGWRLAYVYDTSSFTAGTYDGYSTEIYVMSLAAHLANNHHVDIETQWNSGVNRVLASLVNPAESHLVHSQTAFRAPFLQWLFHMFADVSERGDDTYPESGMSRNPYWNAVLYQREVMEKLADLGRPTFAQPDAADDGTGTTYEQFSLYNDFGQSGLFMPWSATIGLDAEIPSVETAIRDLLSRDLHGPLGISDSVVWATGDPEFSRLPARHDFWNVALSTMAITSHLTGNNAAFAQMPEVSAALDHVLPQRSLPLPVPESLLTFRNWVTFTPTNYNPNLNVFPSEADIEADLRRLYDAGFRGLITYTMDGTLREVPRIAKQVGFDKVIAGIFWFDAAQLERERTATIEELTEDPSYIDGLVVGNEGLFGSRYTRTQLETELQWFSTNTGKPVTTTETGGQYLSDPTLMDLGDWVFPNIQPFCAGIFDPATGAQHVSNEFQAIQSQARQRIPGRITVVKEAWWPSAGQAAGTPDNQSEFLRLLYASPTLFAWGETFDQTWKSAGECSGAGPYWGLYEEDRTWKAVIPRQHTNYTDPYPNTMDFGDAPDSPFPTLLAHNGAGHVINPDFFLGSGVDAEPNGQPDATATGDDTDGNNDDDGLTLNSVLVPGLPVSFSIDASGPGFVDAWIDLNGDGVWSHPTEQFLASAAVVAGANNFNLPIPADASPGTSFVRFRLSSTGGLSPTGLAGDGEVEDYQVRIELPDSLAFYYGDTGDWDVGVSDTTQFHPSTWANINPASPWANFINGDFNGDGYTDILRRNLSSGQLRVLLSNGTSSFADQLWGTVNPNSPWSQWLVGDFDGDGKDDVFRINTAGGGVRVLKSTGSAFVDEAWGSVNPNSPFVGYQVGDFTGDGRDDVLRRNNSGGGIRVFESTGTSFNDVLWGAYNPNSPWVDWLVGDFDGNGKDDLFRWNSVGGGVWVFTSNGTTFSDSLWASVNPNSPWASHQVGDFDGNDSDDVMRRNNASGGLRVFHSTNATSFSDSLWGSVNPTIVWQDYQVADFTADGKTDLARIHPATGAVRVLESGSTTFAADSLWTVLDSNNLPDVVLTGAYAAVPPALSAAGGEQSGNAESLNRDDLASIANAAIYIWQEAGISNAQVELLKSVSVEVANLPGAYLGLAAPGRILVDDNAAGYGWFVDATPRDNSEFSAGATLADLDARLHIDLLTAVMHEMGHVLGYDHTAPFNDDIMNGRLPTGTRRVPKAQDIDSVFADAASIDRIIF